MNVYIMHYRRQNSSFLSLILGPTSINWVQNETALLDSTMY